MKRKSKKRAKRKQPLTFYDGIPELQRTISETGPSIPSEKEHASVQFVVRPFGVAPSTIWDEIKHGVSYLSPTRGGSIVCSTENDIAGEVKKFLTGLILALGLEDDVELHSEIGTFNIRPDLWVVTHHGIAVGVVEVRKPDVPGGVIALDHPNVLGELFDFMKHPPNFCGVTPAFGIVTNLNSWRMAWIPDENGDADRMAAEVSGFDYDSDDEGDEERVGLGKQPKAIHSVDEDKEDENETGAGTIDSSERKLHVSEIFSKNDIETLVRAVVSSLDKMLRCQMTPFGSPFDRMAERTILKFVKGTEKVVCWTRLDAKPQWHKVARPRAHLFAVEDLGRGAHGRVWLTCGSSGAVCVLKFVMSEKEDDAKAEANFWNTAHPEFGVCAEVWSGRPAVQMPHFSSIPPDKREAKIDLVRETLTVKFAQRGLKHNDVHWRNVGCYLDSAGTERVVVFDLGWIETTVDTSWVEIACKQLSSSI